MVILIWNYSDYVSFANLKLEHQRILKLYQLNKVFYGCIFFGFLLLSSSIPTPLVSVLSIAAGVIYGFVVGLIFVSLVCSCGAVVSVFGIRNLAISKRKSFESVYLKKILSRIQEAPYFYSRTVFITTLVGMLPTFSLLTLAGSQLAKFTSFSDIVGLNFLLTIGSALCVLILSRAIVFKYI